MIEGWHLSALAVVHAARLVPGQIHLGPGQILLCRLLGFRLVLWPNCDPCAMLDSLMPFATPCIGADWGRLTLPVSDAM